jgi:hypothetical protein
VICAAVATSRAEQLADERDGVSAFSVDVAHDVEAGD